MWRRRIIVLLIVWVSLTALLAWLYYDVSWLGMLATVIAVAALAWFFSDITEDIAQPDWQGWHPTPVSRPALDGRMALLRRRIERAERPPPRAPADGPDPAVVELQALLRGATRRRLGHDPRPDDHLPADLADYLSADPAPIVPTTTLERLITRIEEL